MFSVDYVEELYIQNTFIFKIYIKWQKHLFLSQHLFINQNAIQNPMKRVHVAFGKGLAIIIIGFF